MSYEQPSRLEVGDELLVGVLEEGPAPPRRGEVSRLYRRWTFHSAALDLAWVAAGRLDAYFEVSRSPWDSAAGELLVREAGGVVTWTEHTEIVASGRPLHPALIALLRASHEIDG